LIVPSPLANLSSAVERQLVGDAVGKAQHVLGGERVAVADQEDALGRGARGLLSTRLDELAGLLDVARADRASS
jgi:hypothetical protein